MAKISIIKLDELDDLHTIIDTNTVLRDKKNNSLSFDYDYINPNELMSIFNLLQSCSLSSYFSISSSGRGVHIIVNNTAKYNFDDRIKIRKALKDCFWRCELDSEDYRMGADTDLLYLKKEEKFRSKWIPFNIKNIMKYASIKIPTNVNVNTCIVFDGADYFS